MKPPKSIKIVKNNHAETTVDIPDLPKQQLVDKPILTTEVITNEVVENQSFFPRGIHIEDLDAALIQWVKDFNYVLEGSQVPTILFSLQRFGEFMQTWDITDETQHPKLPIVTITKETAAKQGSMLGTFSSVLPSNDTYAFYRVPKIINGRTLFEYVEVPQPTYIDIQYKINVFVNHQRDVNRFNEIILQEFKKPQNSINVYGHNMELHLEDISENNKNELEERRYYRHIFVVTLKGFLLDEKDFKVKRSLNSINFSTEIPNTKNNRKCDIDIINAENLCETCLLFSLNRKSSTTIEYQMPFSIDFTYDNQSTLFENVNYYVNNIAVSLPFSINQGGRLKIVYLNEITKPLQIKICGVKN